MNTATNYFGTEEKILRVLFEDGSTADSIWKALWRTSGGSKSKAMEIVKSYAKPEFWEGCNDFEDAFDLALARNFGDGLEIEWERP